MMIIYSLQFRFQLTTHAKLSETMTTIPLQLIVILLSSSVAQQTFNINSSNISGNSFYGSVTTPSTHLISRDHQNRDRIPTRRSNRGRGSDDDGDGDRHNFNFDGTYSGNKFSYTYIKNQNVHYARENHMPKRDVEGSNRDGSDASVGRDASVGEGEGHRAPLTSSEEYRRRQEHD